MFLLAQKRVHFYTIISDDFIDQPNFTQEVCYETNIKRPYDTDYNRYEIVMAGNDLSISEVTVENVEAGE